MLIKEFYPQHAHHCAATVLPTLVTKPVAMDAATWIQIVLLSDAGCQSSSQPACTASDAKTFAALFSSSRKVWAQVYLQPTGLLSTTGLAVQTPFLRTLLDKWNVKATVIKREEYKNAANSITESDYTPAHRQATEELLQSFMSGITADIAGARDLTQAEVSSPERCASPSHRVIGSILSYELAHGVQFKAAVAGMGPVCRKLA